MAQVTIHTGPDVDYYLESTGANYYLLDDEPPGFWIGKAAADLGLSGNVDPDQLRALYHHHVGPDGQALTKRPEPTCEGHRMWETIEAEIAEQIEALGPLATPQKCREIRLSVRGRDRRNVPFYDMTFSSEKSVSVAWAGARAAAMSALAEQKRADGEQDTAAAEQHKAAAARFEALARSAEQSTVVGARAMLAYAENNGGAMVRTGHHSKDSGEWRDATGLIGAAFLQHTSRANDPQLHCQIPVANLAQRADGADSRWRALDGSQLYRLRLGAAAAGSAASAEYLVRQGFPLRKRADGNGFEIGGIEQRTMDAFSQRSAEIEKEKARLVAEYEAEWGEIGRGALYRLRKRITVATRASKGVRPKKGPRAGASKAEAEAEAAKIEKWMDRADEEQAQDLDGIPAAIERYKAEHPEAFPSSEPSKSERDRIARAALAEAQRQNSGWTLEALRWEVFRQIPVLPAATDWWGYITEIADDILSNRIDGLEPVLQIGHMPDVVDVSGLGHRLSDGTSVYRKPNAERYCTASHLDRERWIIEEAARPVPQLISEETAAAQLAGTNLDYDQRRAATGLLTSTTVVTSLIAPAGAGKTHVMGPVSRAWMEETGARVIGLTLSQNASREMYKAGVAESYNIARFLAHKIPVYKDDLLVIDEAGQVSTADLARLEALAKRAGARLILTGDPAQLGPVEAGGLFRVLAEEAPRYELTGIHRFREGWEAEASRKLRAGDMSAWIEYGSRGLVHEGPEDRVMEQAAESYLLDTRHGTALLVTATNDEAARLSALVRELRVEKGEVPAEPEITLSDGNGASAGDLIRARLNSSIEIDGGRVLENRDTIRLEGWLQLNNGREAVAVLRDPEAEGGWSRRFTIPESYLRENAELDYAGNTHVSQGRTVDRQTLLVTQATSHPGLYVGQTRGREENKTYVVTGPPDPNDWTRQQRKEWRAEAMRDAARLHEAGDLQGAIARVQMPEPEGTRPRLPWESVIAGAMRREDPALSATEILRNAKDAPRNSRHLYNLAEAAWWQEIAPEIDAMVRARIPEPDYQRYQRDPARTALLQELRRRETAGQAIPGLLDTITRQALDGLRSIPAGLHGRLDKQPEPEMGRTRTWGERIPEQWRRDHPFVHEKYQALDERQRELGERVAEQPPPWALEAWGVPPREDGALRDDWVSKAAEVQHYRELAGITDEAQALGPLPARQGALTEAAAAAVRALALPDETAFLRMSGQGDLEARVREAEREQAAAPADVRSEMETNRAALEYAGLQAEQARETGNPEMTVSAEALQATLGREQARLRVADAARREWDEAHAGQAEAAERARGELRRRNPERVRGVAERLEETDAEPQHVDPEAYAQQKAAQTASVEADRQARREANAAAIAEWDPELARSAYPDITLEEPEHGREPTPAERDAADLEAIRSARRAVDRAQSQLEIQEEEERRRNLQRGAEIEAEHELEHDTGYRHHPPMQPPPSLGIDRDGPEPHL